MCNADLIITSCNTTSQALFQCAEEELVGKSIQDASFIFLDKDGTLMLPEEHPVNLVVQKGRPRAEMDIGIRYGTSDTTWCTLGVNPDFNEDGEIVQCTLSFLRQSDFAEKRSNDRASRRKEDGAIRRAKDEWEKTFDAIQDIITILDADMRIVRANKTAHDMFQLDYGELTGKKCYEVFHDRNTVCEDCAIPGKYGDTRTLEGTVYNEKVNKTFEVSSAPLFDEKGRVQRRVHIARDVTRQKEDETERDLLSKVIEQALEVIVVTDKNGRIQYVNPAFEQMAGYLRTEVTGENLCILKSGEYEQGAYEEMWSTLQEGKVWSGRLDNRKKDGTPYREDVTISPVSNGEGDITNFVAVKHDITKESQLEKQLQKAMKMEAIGTLAGGIAHDFNNILSAMIGYGQIAKGILSPNDPVQNDIDQILQAGDRAVDLVKQILTFSRLDEQEAFQLLEVPNLLKEVFRLMRSSLPSTIELVSDIDKGCGLVLADSSQIHQVLMNLFANAKQAIGGECGRIMVKLSEVEVEADLLPDVNLLLKPGKYLDSPEPVSTSCCRNTT